ncbi:MAG: ABC transporter substrate-binding protein, partial [Planctomycetes bacterium]|nr:ABC transporter substrate-binding protein [Planctomycetota bacterium]
MKTGLASLLTGFLFTGMAMAEEVNTLKAEPDVLLESRLEQVLTVLQQGELDPNIMAARVEKIVTPLLDLDAMPRLAIRDHWRRMTKGQRTRYQTLFVEYLKDSYRSKLMLYSNEEVTYKKPVITKTGLVQIPTELKSKDKIMKVLY